MAYVAYGLCGLWCAVRRYSSATRLCGASGMRGCVSLWTRGGFGDPRGVAPRSDRCSRGLSSRDGSGSPRVRCAA
eukprot:1263007-Prymnesium_polylepis.1